MKNSGPPIFKTHFGLVLTFAALLLSPLPAMSKGKPSEGGGGGKNKDSTPPSAVVLEPIDPAGVTGHLIRLRWNAVGDDGLEGRATAYQVRYSKLGAINDSNWAQATPVERASAMKPRNSGHAEVFVIRLLNPNTTYHAAVRVMDEAGNLSPISNSVFATTLATVDWEIEWVDEADSSSFKLTDFEFDPLTRQPTVVYNDVKNGAFYFAYRDFNGQWFKDQMPDTKARNRAFAIQLSYNPDALPAVAYISANYLHYAELNASGVWEGTVLYARDVYYSEETLEIHHHPISGEPSVLFKIGLKDYQQGFAFMHRNGNTWTEEVVKTFEWGSGTRAKFIYGPLGTLYLTYTLPTANGEKELYLTWKDGGAWQLPVFVESRTSSIESIQMAMDGDMPLISYSTATIDHTELKLIRCIPKFQSYTTDIIDQET